MIYCRRRRRRRLRAADSPRKKNHSASESIISQHEPWPAASEVALLGFAAGRLHQRSHIQDLLFLHWLHRQGCLQHQLSVGKGDPEKRSCFDEDQMKIIRD